VVPADRDEHPGTATRGIQQTSERNVPQVGQVAMSEKYLPKDTASLDRSTLNIAGRNDFSGILLHAIPDGGTAIWRQPYRPRESNLRTPRIGPARQTQMPHKWDCG
jgi:hypothetical protein